MFQINGLSYPSVDYALEVIKGNTGFLWVYPAGDKLGIIYFRYREFNLQEEKMKTCFEDDYINSIRNFIFTAILGGRLSLPDRGGADHLFVRVD